MHLRWPPKARIFIINPNEKGDLPGQGPLLQDLVSSLFPMQSLPPKVGGGLVQVRDRL